jgi:integrase
MPKKPARQVEAFTRNEQSIINHYLSEHPDHYALAILISMYCGLRIGEVCALQWKDINLKEGIITVSKTLIRIQNRNSSDDSKTSVVMQKPKTETSSRKVPMPECMR